jgi:hypothetical protein
MSTKSHVKVLKIVAVIEDGCQPFTVNVKTNEMQGTLRLCILATIAAIPFWL